MAVDTKHPSYSEAMKRTARCRDFISGEDTVKAKGEDYLPKLGGQDEDDYKGFKMRAYFYNASSRTSEGLSGMMFWKPYKFSGAKKIEQVKDDMSTDGMSMEDFVRLVGDEILHAGRCGVLVDVPRTDAQLSKADAEKLNIRPMWSMYGTESIINWKFKVVNNRRQLSLVVLEESVEKADNDEFESDTETQYRVLDLADGYYRQRIFRKNYDGEYVQDGNDIFPTMKNKKLTYIPFFIVSASTDITTPAKPPLLDLVNTNLAHYQTKADHRHALHFVALPTPYIIGIDKESAPTSIGPEAVWCLPNTVESVGMLEFTGSGLSEVREELKMLEHYMATLGARMLSPESATNETATASSIRHMGETSSLADIANAIGASFKEICSVTEEWLGGTSTDIEFVMNTDYIPSNLDPQMILALVQLYQGGSMSKESLFNKLKAGEIFSEDVTFEEEEERIQEGMPDVSNEDKPDVGGQASDTTGDDA